MTKYFWWFFLPFHIFLIKALTSFDPSWSAFGWVFFFWTLVSGLGIGVGYHRLMAHKSFTAKPIIRDLLAFLGCFGLQGSPISWVNIHRSSHHAHTDTVKDVHSPVNGKYQSYIGWAIDKEPNIPQNTIHDLMRSKFQRFLYNYYIEAVWASWALLGLINVKLLFFLLIAQAIALHQELVVNLFCHMKSWFGYRNYETKDNTINIWLFGLLFWGVGYHNNHHAEPRNPNFARRWFEFDPTTILVWLVKDRSNDRPRSGPGGAVAPV